ncbi:histidinol-phosphate transaminase [Paractinoplanes toevensis]|uniref:Phenylalanine aminotransferase n=1 Tax=Paractinoplanes toevensis TaxID=571911 RepID=A0A919TCM1_9ACTN|nr:histidinol-phosphate transaminase [Actinoplanes toevensis]GIM92622.1 putative phenylalanine aminotransferase [Actinoplanes toevensis]
MPDLGPKLRADLVDVPAYETAIRVDDHSGYRLHRNENSQPPQGGVLARISSAAMICHRYPDDRSGELTRRIADMIQVSPDHVVVGAGTTAICQQILLATIGHGDEAVFPHGPERYLTLSRVAGARAMQIPLDGYRQDLASMAAAVTDRTRVIFVCSPLSPTGTVIREPEMRAFLAHVPGDVLVVLDEEYRDYVREPGAVDGIELHREYPNVAVMRTFSKAYGLAGLRAGYAISGARVAEAIRTTALPFGVSVTAQLAATAAVQAGDQVRRRVDTLVSERNRLQRLLRSQGWPVPASQANFVWLPLGEAADDFALACADHGLLVRPYPGWGVRVTVSEPAVNDLIAFIVAGYPPP